jgi:hypothetical protein
MPVGVVKVGNRQPADPAAIHNKVVALAGVLPPLMVLLLAKDRGRDRTAYDADLGVPGDRLGVRDLAVGRNRQYDTGPVVRLGQLQVQLAASPL